MSRRLCISLEISLLIYNEFINYSFFLIPSLFLLRLHIGSNHPLSTKLAGKRLDLEDSE